MRVTIGEHTLPIGHKNMMGSLTEVWKIGNAYRTQRGLPELDLSNWLHSPETLEYVKVVEHDLNFKSVASTDLSTKGVDSTGFIKRGKKLLMKILYPFASALRLRLMPMF